METKFILNSALAEEFFGYGFVIFVEFFLLKTWNFL